MKRDLQGGAVRTYEPETAADTPTWPAILFLALGVAAIVAGLLAGDFAEIAATGAKL
jgi:hypothetical protein